MATFAVKTPNPGLQPRVPRNTLGQAEVKLEEAASLFQVPCCLEGVHLEPKSPQDHGPEDLQTEVKGH